MDQASKRAYHANWSNNNRDKIAEYERRRYAKMSLEKKKKKWDSLRAFAEKNPDYARSWAIKNRKRLAEKRARRRSLICERLHKDANLVAISFLYQNCPKGMEVDHIIPLNAGGWHHELNLQYLPQSLNRSKGDNMYWTSETYKTWLDVPMFLLPEIETK